MRNVKFLYFLAIGIMLIISTLMFYNHWYYFGFLMAVLCIGGIFNYYDIKEHNRKVPPKRYRSRRATYFSNLSRKQKEAYLNNLKNQATNIKNK